MSIDTMIEILVQSAEALKQPAYLSEDDLTTIIESLKEVIKGLRQLDLAMVKYLASDGED